MPAASKGGAAAQKLQDKESKRARGALSCAECRRLKLKCDKTVPCASCKRRGCSAICPNGSLITGQGTRFVLADTEKLHVKIAIMSDRIRQLEDALAITDQNHPLLSREQMKIKSSLELHSAVEDQDKETVTTVGKVEEEETEESWPIDAFGTLAIRDDGASTFFGRSAGQESLLIGELPPLSPDQLTQRSVSISAQSNVSSPGPYTSPEVVNLAANFPLASSMYRPGIDIEYVVNTYVPSWNDATRLAQLYLEQAPWFFGAVTKRQLEEEVLPAWYNEAPRPVIPPAPGGLPAAAASPTPSNSSNGNAERYGPSSPISRGNAHDLALLFMIMCYGSLTDMAMPPAPDNTEAEHFYQLSKVCLTIEPVLERPASVATVQTVSLMAIYEGICSRENSIETTFVLFGLATKLAQSIGLHRDCARWKLSPGEVQKRRALFWELFITDSWQSLATGRLATFSLPFVDCELPYDPDQTMADDGTPQPSFPFWKARFGAECVSAVVQGTLTSRAPKYSIILDLDRKVRDMDLPLYAQGSPPENAGLAQTMSHFMPSNYRELTLLYIHRCFFAHALSSNPQDPIKSQYAPSFLAGYRSACTIVNSVKTQFTRFPSQIARFWVLWTHAFSASVMISSVVTHSPKCKVAPAALLELKTACDLFENASTYGGRAVKFLPILKRLQMKAQQAYRDAHSGVPPKVANDIFRPSDPKEEKDELSIFSGKTTTLTTKVSATGGSVSNNGSPQSVNGSMSGSRAGSGSPGHTFTTDNPAFANVHPSLVNELNMFDGHIRAQIQSFPQASSDVFGMAVDSPARATRAPSLQAVVPPASHNPTPQEQQQAQQQFLQQMEQQQRREEQQRMEVERQQSLARQREEHLMRQHQEAQRQEELRRQQQQKQEEYQQQQQLLQQQQQQQHQHRQMSHHAPPPHQMGPPSAMRDYEPHRGSSYPRPMDTDPYSPPGSAVSPTGPAPVHALHRVPSSRSINMHQAYQHAGPSSMPGPPSHTPYAHQQHASSRQGHHHHPSQSSSMADNHMYSMSPESSSTAPLPHPHSHSHPQYPHSNVHSHTSSPANSYDHHSLPPQQHHRQRDDQPPPPPNYYWSASPAGYSDGPTAQGMYQNGASGSRHPGPPASYHFTPEAALGGMAADDPPLQETWRTYMNNMGTPRQFS